jgi:hypothetical protein
MAEAATPPASARPAPAPPETVPAAEPRSDGGNGGQQPAPCISPSTRLKGLFNELHQARWGSQENPAEPARAEPGARARPAPASSPAELWPRVTSRADAAVGVSGGAPERAPAVARAPLPESDAFSLLAGLSEEEKTALFS